MESTFPNQLISSSKLSKQNREKKQSRLYSRGKQNRNSGMGNLCFLLWKNEANLPKNKNLLREISGSGQMGLILVVVQPGWLNALPIGELFNPFLDSIGQ